MYPRRDCMTRDRYRDVSETTRDVTEMRPIPGRRRGRPKQDPGEIKFSDQDKFNKK